MPTCCFIELYPKRLIYSYIYILRLVVCLHYIVLCNYLCLYHFNVSHGLLLFIVRQV